MSADTSCPKPAAPVRPVMLALVPPTTYLAKFSRSGRQRESRSGRGFPNMFFMPFVMNQAPHIANASPSQPTCNSHNLRFQMRAFGVPLGIVFPGTRTRQTMAMMMMGTRTAQIAASHIGTVSCSVKGKLVGRSVRAEVEKTRPRILTRCWGRGLRRGVCLESRFPIHRQCQQRRARRTNRTHRSRSRRESNGNGANAVSASHTVWVTRASCSMTASTRARGLRGEWKWT